MMQDVLYLQSEVGSSALHVAGATSGRYIFSSGNGTILF